jgi:hypothetical protein
LLLIVFFVAWRFSNWFQPKVDEAISAHFKFMESVKTTQERQAENGSTLATQQTKIGDILDRQERRTEEMADRLKEVHKVIVKPN